MCRPRWFAWDVHWPKSARRTTPCVWWAMRWGVGRVFFQGLGAGQMPTASAVAADMIDTAVGRAAITFRTLGLWSRRGDAPSVEICPPEGTSGRYYMRFTVKDHPGVIAEIASVLGRHTISIASVIQHESPDGDQRVVPW